MISAGVTLKEIQPAVNWDSMVILSNHGAGLDAGEAAPWQSRRIPLGHLTYRDMGIDYVADLVYANADFRRG